MANATSERQGASPDSPDSPERGGVWVLVATMVVALVGVLVGYRDYGPTWDEGVQARYGELALDYFRSGGEDRSCDEYLDLRYYGPLVEMIPALVDRSDGPRKYEIRHLFLGLLFVGSLPAVWLLARRLRVPWAAAFAVVAVATMPRFFAHAFNNSKDMSFALSMLWFMAALAAMFGGDRLTWRRTLVCGATVGLGLCMRPGGLPLFGLFAVTGAGVWWLQRWRSFDGEGGAVRAVPGITLKLTALFVVAWPLMVLPWPWAHLRPIANPLEAIRLATAFPTTVNVLFDGEVITSDRLPWNYLTRYLWIATPLPVLGLAALGLLFGAWRIWREPRSQRAWLLAVTGVWLFAPLALFVVMRPNIHGGVRHFLFILPALGLFAALGAGELVRIAKSSSRWLAPILLGALAWPVVDLARLHPYPVTYYNGLVGGVAGAAERDWTDYYLSSYAEAMRWVSQEAERTPNERASVWLAAGPSVLLWVDAYAGPNVDVSLLHALPARPERLEADFFITSTRYGTTLFPEAPVVHSIGRAEATFTIVRGRGADPPSD